MLLFRRLASIFKFIRNKMNYGQECPSLLYDNHAVLIQTVLDSEELAEKTPAKFEAASSPLSAVDTDQEEESDAEEEPDLRPPPSSVYDFPASPGSATTPPRHHQAWNQ